MNEFAVDLSMRSTGVSYFKNGELLDFALVSEDELKDEQLLISNVSRIINWIEKAQACTAQPDKIRIEGLSFGSKSGSKDTIAGQFWYLRCEIAKKWPCTTIEIIPVTSWRSPLFNKAERDALKDAKKTLDAKKLPLKGLKGQDRVVAQKTNHQMELMASIKEATWEKLSDVEQANITRYLVANKFPWEARYDITDSIFLGRYVGDGKAKKTTKKAKKK